MDTFQREALTFDVWDLGPSGGETVILLHGWPQTKEAWSDVAPALSQKGYRVMSPDQRGYSPGARPKGRRHYTMELLVGDVLALADQAGVERFHVVGHDWGGAVAWGCGMWHPERLLSLTSLAVPHPRAYLRALVTSRQFFMSWYAMFFQVPGLPELGARFGPARRYLQRTLARTGLPEDKAATYLSRLGEPDAVTATVNWYRAGLLTPITRYRPVGVPTLYVYASADVALSRRAADLTALYVTGPYRYEVLQGMGHWIPEQAPELVVDLLIEHFAHARTAPAHNDEIDR